MEKEITKLYFNDMTQEKMYDLFGLRETDDLPELSSWLSDLPTISDFEKSIAIHYQKKLIKNINIWNEDELSLNFIGPIFAIIDFTIRYKINWFSQRLITAIINNYELIGKPDGILASGFHSPKIPFFCFQEYKKDINSSGDPIGQNLAAMLVGQQQNENHQVIYGSYIVGRNWYFMALKEHEYAISSAFSADDEEIFEIVKIIKKLQHILFKQIGS